jgi:mono/diheme cytochrome c family protein
VRFILISALVGATLVSFCLGARGQSPETGGDAANGKRLFRTYGCYACHGTTGAGGGIAGPKLAPDPIPYEGIKLKLRTPSGRMPVYSEAVVKDAEIADIAAYLRNVPRGKSAKDIPLLNR